MQENLISYSRKKNSTNCSICHKDNFHCEEKKKQLIKVIFLPVNTKSNKFSIYKIIILVKVVHILAQTNIKTTRFN